MGEKPIEDPQGWAIQIQGLCKSFGRHQVLKGVDLKARKGEFLVLFGPNGAGKTTLIKILATLSRPSSGSARLMGQDLLEDALGVRAKVGVVLHQTLLYDDLTPKENLLFYGRMFGVPNLERRIHALLDQVGLSERLHDRVRTLSRGMQQRLSIARALLHDPPILLLDEPETGLDQHAASVLGELLHGVEGDKTVLMTTHNLERGLGMGDHMAILAGGRIVYEEVGGAPDPARFRGTYYQYTGARR